MTIFTVPERGIVLDGSPHNKTDAADPPVQVMQLDLADGTIEELFKCARQGKPIHVAFGKAISLHYGTKQRPLSSTPSSADTHIYSTSPDDSNGDHRLQLAGRVSHTLALQKAQEDTAGADDALLQLQNSLNKEKQARASNQIQFISDGSKLPPAKKQTAAGLKSKSSLSFLKGNLVTRSTPASPSIGAGTVPHKKNTPAAASNMTNGKAAQIAALRTPLIHLLATRPLSVKFLAGKMNCSQEMVNEALAKVSKDFRLDPMKRDLNDKVYKDLDVWGFNYPEASDREAAIDRSISAFDRMRVSQEDRVWQKLYPKEERNKGNTLSRLNHLAKGAIQNSSTPRIHVQQPEDSVDEKPLKESSGESDQKGRLTPKASDMARSKSTDQIKKKKKVGEKEAQAKRLLSNGPKKATSEVKEKESHPAVRKGGPKKVTAPKSAEFVHDSDEEDGLEESMAIDAQNSPPTKATKPASSSQAPTTSSALKGVSAKISKKVVPAKSATPKPITTEKNVKVSKPAKPVHVVQASFPNLKTTAASDVRAKEDEAKKAAERKAHPKKIPSSPAATPGAKARLSEAANQQGSTAMQKSLSRNRTLSSPHKPSPLGSSPPTNASEFDHQQHNNNNITPPSSASSSEKNRTTINGAHGHRRNFSSDSSLKPTGNYQQQQLGHSRTPSSSDAPLKRKANDLDSGIHNHTTSSPMSNGSGRILHNPAKKRKTSSEEEEESSTSPLSEHELKMQEAQRFKRLHAKYEQKYREVMENPEASLEQVQVVSKMHVRLDEMKRNIARGRY